MVSGCSVSVPGQRDSAWFCLKHEKDSRMLGITKTRGKESATKRHKSHKTLWAFCAFLWLIPLSFMAQGQSSLTGVIDIHAHTDPDSRPRSIDAIDVAKLAKARGMRGLVLKNHYE